jgi:hypothetical protein
LLRERSTTVKEILTGWKILQSNEVHTACFSLNIVRIFKIRKICEVCMQNSVGRKGCLRSISLTFEGTEHPRILGFIGMIVYVIKILCKVPT